MPRPTQVRLAALAALTSAIVALGVVSALPEATAKNGPMHGAPKAGQCYRTPGKVAFRKPATQRPPISCAKSHRLWIVKVKRVPAKIKVNARKSNKRFWRFESNVCAKAYRLAIGKLDKRFGMSSYARFSFIPTKKQRAHGAHWLSCELGIRGGGKKGMAVKPNRIRKPPRLRRNPSDIMRLCATKRAILTNCSNGHTFRAKVASRYNSPRKGHVRKAKRMCRHRLGVHHTWVYAWRGLHGKPPWVVTCLPKGR